MKGAKPVSKGIPIRSYETECNEGPEAADKFAAALKTVLSGQKAKKLETTKRRQKSN